VLGAGGFSHAGTGMGLSPLQSSRTGAQVNASDA
jgi:hypothetical protein